jgi:hypothetical protein
MIYKIGKKAGYENSFFAFIPIANTVMMLNISGRSGWNIFLLLIPIFNVFYSLYISFSFLNSFTNGDMVFIAEFILGIILAIYQASTNNLAGVMIFEIICILPYAYLAFNENVKYHGTIYEGNSFD